MSRRPGILVRVDSARLAAAIAASGLSDVRIARRAGIQPATLHHLRRGESSTWRVVGLVAQALGVDPADLLAEEPQP